MKTTALIVAALVGMSSTFCATAAPSVVLPATLLSPDTFRPYIVAWEGYRHMPYERGNERSVGIGHNTARDGWREYYSDWAIERAYERDYAIALAACRREVDDFDTLPLDARMAVLSLSWSVGPRGLHLFRVMRMALNNRDYDRAAYEIGHSLWARQVSASRLADHVARLRSCER